MVREQLDTAAQHGHVHAREIVREREIVDPEPAQQLAHPQHGRHLAVVAIVRLRELAVARDERLDERVEVDVTALADAIVERGRRRG